MKRNIPRTILAVLAALALGVLLLGCGGSREGAQQQGGSQEEESAQEPVAGEFVGFARDAQGVAGSPRLPTRCRARAARGT